MATGSVSVGREGITTNYGYSNGYVGSSYGSIDPEPFELEGNVVWEIQSQNPAGADNNTWLIQIRGVHSQNLFSSVEIQEFSGDFVTLDSADAFYSQNVPSDLTSWSWSSQSTGWATGSGIDHTVRFY